MEAASVVKAKEKKAATPAGGGAGASTSAAPEQAAAGMPRFLAGAARAVQCAPAPGRTCACGRPIAAGGECAACRARRPAGRAARSGAAGLVQRAPESGAPPADFLAGGVASTGAPLPAAERAHFEAALGTDLRQVRLHTTAAAAQAAGALEARAFTAGTDIYFQQGEYAPGSAGGRRLLAHELVHVVQQRAGVQLANGIGQTGDPYEQQADSVADAISNGRRVRPLMRPAIGRADARKAPQAAPVVQRDGKGEHAAETKGQFAQRVWNRAAERLTKNIAVLDEWSTYVKAMEGFQLRAQLLSGIATEYALAAAPTPGGRVRFETWAGTQNEAERAFQGSMLDIEAPYRARAGDFMAFLSSKTQGYETTPSVAQNLQVLAGDRRAEDLPQSVHVGADLRYSEYAPIMKRVQSGDIGACETCHEINRAWGRTAERWGSPLPSGDFLSEPVFIEGGIHRPLLPSRLSPSTLSKRDEAALVAFIDASSQSSAPPPAAAALPPVTPTPAAPPSPESNPFMPGMAIPKGVEVPPPRTDLCGELPPAEESERIPSLAAWGPNSAIVAGVIARIDAVLTPLGPRGYRVLGRQNFDALYAMSPDNMQSVRDGIIARIADRRKQYGELRTEIQAGDVPYEELCPIVDELLPSTNDSVRWQALLDVHNWQQRERLLQIVELVLLALTIIFPPSAVVTVPAGMALGLARMAMGIDQRRQGRQWSAGTGSRLYSLAQEAEAPGLAQRGRSNMIFGAVGFVFSAFSAARMITLFNEMRATQRLLQTLEAGAIIRHAQFPGVALLARNGRLLMVTDSGQILGYGMIANGKIWWTRLPSPVQYGAGVPGTPLLAGGPSVRGLLPPAPYVIVDAQSGYPTFLRNAVAQTPGASGVGVEGGNFLLGYQGIFPVVQQDLALAQQIARHSPQWGQSYAVLPSGGRTALPITQWPRIGELSDLSLAGMSADDQLFWGSQATLAGRYRMPPAAGDPTALFPGSTRLVPSATIEGAWEVQPIPFAVPPPGGVTVIPRSFFPAYGGPAAVSGPQGSGWALMRPRLVPRGAGDVAGITPTQHPELYGRAAEFYLRRPFGLGRASAGETQALGGEINRILAPGGFAELRLTRSDLLAPGQLQTIQAQIPGSTTVIVDQAAIDAFRATGALPADAMQAAILRNAATDINQAFDPLGLARMAQIIRIFKPLAR